MEFAVGVLSACGFAESPFAASSPLNGLAIGTENPPAGARETEVRNNSLPGERPFPIELAVFCSTGLVRYCVRNLFGGSGGCAGCCQRETAACTLSGMRGRTSDRAPCRAPVVVRSWDSRLRRSPWDSAPRRGRWTRSFPGEWDVLGMLVVPVR